MKLLYWPFSIVAGALGNRAGRQLFEAIWNSLSESPEPSVDDADAHLGTILASAALQGASVAASVALAQQLTLRLFRHLFGVWPADSKSTRHADAA